jgi:hypothetical protein
MSKINGCPHHCGLPMSDITKLLGINLDTFTFAAGAQYIVPKRFILSKSLSWWKRALEIHTNHNKSPWIFERLWPIIWEMSDR